MKAIRSCKWGSVRVRLRRNRYHVKELAREAKLVSREIKQVRRARREQARFAPRLSFSGQQLGLSLTGSF